MNKPIGKGTVKGKITPQELAKTLKPEERPENKEYLIS